MARLTEVVEGWTGALPFTLNADGVPVDLTGMIVHIILKHADGTVIRDTTAGITVSSSESTGGVVRYAPSSSSGDLFLVSKTPYYIRFRVTDALAKVVYFPNADEDVIVVNRV